MSVMPANQTGMTAGSMKFSPQPPATPWGINFGGGLNSTALIIEARDRGLRPDWILFADTGSERPETLAHLDHMRRWCEGWCAVTSVRWDRSDGTFRSIHEDCLKTGHLPSKAYGLAGCTMKWKVQPMDKWRKEHGFQRGAVAIGYDASEHRRIAKACQRGDDPNITTWYPLVSWGIDRPGCKAVCDKEGISIGKSSCFMCPNMRRNEWVELAKNAPNLFSIAVAIEDAARDAGNMPYNGKRWPSSLRELIAFSEAQGSIEFDASDDRCVHGGCFT
jgi:hypothetical protein